MVAGTGAAAVPTIETCGAEPVVAGSTSAAPLVAVVTDPLDAGMESARPSDWGSAVEGGAIAGSGDVALVDGGSGASGAAATSAGFEMAARGGKMNE